MRGLPFTIVGSLALWGASALHAELPHAFLKQYCFNCHGPDKQKADRRFDGLPAAIADFGQQEQWQEIVDQLNLGEMPPDDEPQPSPAERLAAIQAMTDDIADARERFAGVSRHTTLRRLNKVEFQQTIGDLLGLNVEAWNPAEDFPCEVTSDGFDNDGAQLVTSGLLLEKYLLAAEAAIERATQFGTRPLSTKYVQQSPFYFEGKTTKDLPKLFKVDRYRFVPETPYTDLYGRAYRGGHIGFLPLVRQGGLPHSGRYTIRVRAAAIDRTHPYGKTVDNIRNGAPLVLELASVDRRGSVTLNGNVSRALSLSSFELTSPKPQWFEWTGYMEKGYEPEVRFRNGPVSTKNLVFRFGRNADRHPEFATFAALKPGTARSHGVLKAYRGPKLRVWEIQLEGPHVEAWPPRGHRALYGDLKPENLTPETINDRLSAFAASAFRRPRNEGELAPIRNLVAAKLNAGLPPLEALQVGFQAILCAPGFLYLREGEGPLSGHALASRLSYFLWSSMPDRELLGHAADGTLSEPEARRKQVERMLADPTSQRFVRNFTRIWLALDNIGKMPPSKDFLSYYRDNLGSAMRQETELLFRHILDHNLAPRQLLAADYSFLNRELAEHYGISGLQGNHFRRVSLPSASRGGILGHGSFLTASANGVDTSPVVRGIYVMNTLLDYHPPPPPDDVPAIEPDVRGATTLREQLIKHRADPSCAQCHSKIDPPGFALENYDAVGAWRDQYARRLPVDASGKLPDGSSFTSNAEFRALIIGQSATFTRCLSKKLLTYAIGRRLNSSDRPSIDKICNEMANSDKGLHDLIQAIVASESFQTN